MKKILLFFIASFLAFNVFSQNQGNVWYFGQNAGVDFNSGTPIALSGGAMITNEGVATISDNAGNLRFYTDGASVWNSSHIVEATHLQGNSTSTQSAIILPFINDPDKYYIFTIDGYDVCNGALGSPGYTVPSCNGDNGFQYCEVDLSSGFSVSSSIGLIHPGNTNIDSYVAEKISAVISCDGTGYWVTVHSIIPDDFYIDYVNVSGAPTCVNESNQIFYTYYVDDSGVSPSPIIFTDTGNDHTHAGGYMKFSPNGQKLAVVNRNVGIDIYDFDNDLGVISNIQTILLSDKFYGIEFSASCDYLFFGQYTGSMGGSVIKRCDLSIMNIITVTETGMSSGLIKAELALQLAPDENIYVAIVDDAVCYNNSTPPTNSNSYHYLGRITNTDNSLVSFQNNYLDLGSNKQSNFGLPTFVQNFFTGVDIYSYTEDCNNYEYSFGITNNGGNIYSPTWIIEGTNYSGAYVTHIFSGSGTYTVTLTYLNEYDCINTAELIMEIEEPADATISITDVNCESDLIAVTYEVCNIDIAEIPIGTHIIIYDNDPSQYTANIVEDLTTNQIVAAGDCEEFTFYLSQSYLGYELYAVVNIDDGTLPTPYTLDDHGLYEVFECNWLNNITNFPVICCFAEISDEYEHITSSVVISNQYTVLNGKYYIDDGVIVTINGGTLDITNVDIVFGECAGINFINAAEIRANNSVLRPCLVTDSWRGLYFENGSNGTINECTFKNAQIALNYNGKGVISSTRITNNLFSNCGVAINIQDNQFNNPISGNTFIIDDSAIDYNPIDCPFAYTSEHWGIRIVNTNQKGLISQNDFIYTPYPELIGTGNTSNKYFYGIYCLNTTEQANISDNKFTDMYRCIDIDNCSNITFENNEIEVNKNFNPSEYQVRATNSNLIRIIYNEFESGVDYNTDNYPNSAVYAEKLTSSQINNNFIKGFKNGIRVHHLNACTIIENNLEDMHYIGIFLYILKDDVFTPHDVDIACNYIKMNPTSVEHNVTGILYITRDDFNYGVRIRNNCIFESQRAMRFYTNAHSDPILPEIKNNFMYNYTEFGILIQSYYSFYTFSGDIGSAGGTFSNAGRNSFFSNDLNAIDVSSNSVTNLYGNYNIQNIAGTNVNNFGNNEFYSTASCSHQYQQETGNYSQHNIETSDICDNFIPINQGKALMISGDNVELTDNFISIFNELDETQQLGDAVSILKILKSTGNIEDFNKYHDNISVEFAASSNDKKWFEYNYQYLSENYDDALNSLNSIVANTSDETDLIAINSILIDREINERGNDLTQNEIEMLTSIDDNESLNASFARDILHSSIKGHDYKFAKIDIEEIENEDEESMFISRGDFKVFPNPTSDELNLVYFFDDISNASIKIFDIQGKMLYQENLQFNAGRAIIDCSGIEKGIYILTIYKGSEVLQREKITKF